ncbi:MAG: MiaB/RimO family radical SAM methylthiotransferase [Candidatus Gracilibacteria bacterium]|nr:MiaB/RimO family radical SAM methylthiotransferase [Candidatus Gracilibacteria bacterium]
MFNFSAINLGCNKNLVDTEYAIGEILKGRNEEINFFENPEDDEVEYVLINTCGFLSSSRDEAEETIAYYDSIGKKVIIMGCYTSVKDDNFIKNLKNLHSIIDYTELSKIEKIPEISKDKLKSISLKFKDKELDKYLKNIGGNQIEKKAFIWKGDEVRAYLNADFSYEFLKISEGCDNNCSFCIIPKIRGRQSSRKIEDILNEVKLMIKSGIKEIEIISQDTTRYGTDLYGETKLLDLLEEIDKISGDFKFRLFYMYPDTMTLSGLERLKNLKKMLPYFDIPFQHISPNILKKMGRFYDDNHIFKMLDYIKSEFPGIFIHTNFIVGFPGEAEEDFEMLLEFAKKYEFDSVSVFGYHDEILAASSKLGEKVDDKTINLRLKTLKKVLNEIYEKKQNARIGNKEIGFIHEIKKDKVIIRSEIKAPEIDDYDKVWIKDVISPNIDLGEKVEYIVR